jgi:NitT/TauT family transport system permease protein
MALPNILQKTVSRQSQPGKFSFRRFMPLVMLVILLILWQLVTAFEWVSPFLVPTPADVMERFYTVALQPSRINFWMHVWQTLQGILVGMSLGVGIGFLLGYIIAKQPWLEDLLSPIVVAFQATPIVAYAPLLVIWFDEGMTSKVFVVVLIVFFPMLMNTIVGIRSVPRDLRDLMRVSRATRWQTFTKLEIPAAMPVLMGGLKLAATLAVIGSVVGEFVNADAGLGFLINDARYRYDTPLVFVAVLTLTALALTLYTLVSALERRVLAWQDRTRRD